MNETQVVPTRKLLNYTKFDLAPTEAKPIFAWVRDLPFEAQAYEQVQNVSRMPFVYPHVAVMPDVHAGIGATVGSVIPTLGAVIPAAVGVDIGCGMMAVPLYRIDWDEGDPTPGWVRMTAADLPENLAALRSAIEKAVPHGRTNNGKVGADRGAWGNVPQHVDDRFVRTGLASRYTSLVNDHPQLNHLGVENHLGTLGTGNHFIELCLDENQQVWVMLHSGSRGVGNKIGIHFIEVAKEDMRRYFINLPDKDLAYFPEGTDNFYAYVRAIEWAQDYAKLNREVMMAATIQAISRALYKGEPDNVLAGEGAVQCHHNYLSREHHFGKNVLVTRKGAVRAREGDMGIIPGSMGAKSFIVRGLGNPLSLTSCSHGAGRSMSRTEAKKRFTVADHEKATEGVECRKDADVVDETPMAYKSIDAVMSAQDDLVEIVHTLKQVLCVKG